MIHATLVHLLRAHGFVIGLTVVVLATWLVMSRTASGLCQRDDVTRENQTLILTELINMGDVFNASSKSPQVRRYFAVTIPRLTAARRKATPIEC